MSASANAPRMGPARCEKTPPRSSSPAEATPGRFEWMTKIRAGSSFFHPALSCLRRHCAHAVRQSRGGAAFGYLELCVIAEELGRSLAPTPFSATIYLAAEALLRAGSEAQKKRWLPRIAQGQAIGCFALSEGPGVATPGNVSVRADGGRI